LIGTKNALTELRLDVWLWRARFYKSRALSTRTVRDGKIRLQRFGHTNRTSKPNTLVRPGDRLTFMRGEQLFHIEIQGLGIRRGPAPEAHRLYTNVQTENDVSLTA
jgi:ribosome-associated heat shock protein Hsp15